MDAVAAVTESPALQPDGPPPADSPLRRIRHYGAMLRDPIAAVGQRFARYGDIYRVQFREGALYVVRHPDHIRDVLVNEGEDFGKTHSAFMRLRELLGDALLTSEGENWRRQRRLVQPAFARPRLAEYAAVMVEEALQTTEGLLAGGAERVVALSSEMTSLTLRIVARALFGQRVDDSPRVGRAMIWLNSAFSGPELLPRSIPTPKRVRARRAVSDLDAAVYELIDRRNTELSRASSNAQPDIGASAHPNDLLQRLLDARDDADGSGLSRREIRDQLLTLYLAGHETTSHALSWTFYLLSQNPDALRALRAELDRELDHRPPCFEDLPKLTYCEWALKEAMRLYPPVTAIPRRALRDTRIGKYAVAAGSEVIVWNYHTHHDRRFFPEPERYRPERFSEAESASRPKHAYLPFGAGQRACIGQVFALMEGQLILATLLQRVELTYVGKGNPGVRLGVTLAPKNGVPMRVGKRG